MKRRYTRAVSFVALFSIFSVVALNAQNRPPLRLVHSYDRRRCVGDLESTVERQLRFPRTALISYFAYGEDCGSLAGASLPDPPERSAHPRSKLSELASDVPAAGVPEAATYDLIESELRGLHENGLLVVIARRHVLAILRENNSCSAWYAQSEPNPFAKLASLHFQLDADGENTVLGDRSYSGVLYREPYVARAQQNVGAGSTITLNAHGAFFVSRAPVKSGLSGGLLTPEMDRMLHVGRYAGGSLNAQVTTLLHEFAHVVDLLPVDMGESGSPLLSTQNTDTVLQHCHKQIEASARRAIVLPVSLARFDRHSGPN